MATANTDDPGDDEPEDGPEDDAGDDQGPDGYTCGHCRRGRCARCNDKACSCCAGGDPEPWPPRW